MYMNARSESAFTSGLRCWSQILAPETFTFLCVAISVKELWIVKATHVIDSDSSVSFHGCGRPKYFESMTDWFSIYRSHCAFNKIFQRHSLETHSIIPSSSFRRVHRYRAGGTFRINIPSPVTLVSQQLSSLSVEITSTSSPPLPFQ